MIGYPKLLNPMLVVMFVIKNSELFLTSTSGLAEETQEASSKFHWLGEPLRRYSFWENRGVESATPATKSCFSQRCCAVFRTQRCGFNNVVHTSAAKVWFRIFSNSYSKKFFRIEEYRKITGTTNRLHTIIHFPIKNSFSLLYCFVIAQFVWSCGMASWIH